MPGGNSPSKRALRLIRGSLKWTALLLLVLFLAALWGCAPSSGRPGQPVAQPGAQSVGLPQGDSAPGGAAEKTGAGGKKSPAVKALPAAVTRVVDGDTVYVNVGGRSEKVRFIGVDTPESTAQVEPYGREASNYTEKRLSGRNVWLELDVEERDQYGRLLAYVWLEPPQSGSESEVRAKMFNAELLLAGMAQVMTVPPNVRYADVFLKLQREAREAGKGLWGIPASGGSGSAESRYVGNLRSKKFHRADCEWATKMSPANRVYFKTREEAVRQGYAPCRVCQP